MKQVYFLALIFIYELSYTQKAQFFNLDTITNVDIHGKKGTTIFFNRNDFDLNSTSKITLELQESFDLSNAKKGNLIPRQYGYLKFHFYSNGKEIKLKRGKKLDVSTPKNNLRNINHHVFESSFSKNSVSWERNNQAYERISVDVGGGISVIKLKHKDTIAKCLKNKNRSFKTQKEFIKENNKYIDLYPNFIYKKHKPIESSDFISVTQTINFNIKKLNQFYFQPEFYIYYKNERAFQHISFPHDKKIKFKDIPIFENTFLIAVRNEYNGTFYTDKIRITSKTDHTEVILNMKKTTKEELKKLFDS